MIRSWPGTEACCINCGYIEIATEELALAYELAAGVPQHRDRAGERRTRLTPEEQVARRRAGYRTWRAAARPSSGA